MGLIDRTDPHISTHLWASLSDPDGTAYPDLPFPQVVAWLTGGTIPDEGGLSFASFGDKRSPKGNSLRHIPNVTAVHALAIDVDGGASLDAVFRAFQGFAHLVYETKRSTLDAPRCRVIVPLAEPATPEHYRQIASAYIDHVRRECPAAYIDESATCDPSRLWFPPRAANSRAPRHVYSDGAALPLPPYQTQPKTPVSPLKSSRKTPPRGWVSHLSLADGSDTTHEALRASAAAWVAQGAPPSHDDAWIAAVLQRVSAWPADCPAHRHERSVDDVYLTNLLTSARVKFEIPDSDRPTIELGADIHRVVDEVCEHLTDAHVYQRGGALCVTTQRLDPTPDGPPAPTLCLKTIDEHSLRVLVSRILRFTSRNTAGDYTYKPPPVDIVRAILHRGTWPVPPLLGLAETPILHADGSVHAEHGYDHRTGYYLDAPIDYAILDPTREMAQEALRFLFEPFAEFEAESVPSHYVPVAAILTMLARPLIDNVPVFCLDATIMGSGKTLAADVISTIGTGHITAKTQFPYTIEEQDKVLAALALQGNTLVAFDNVDRPITGGALERVLTSRGKVALRVLGKSEAPTIPWAPVFLFTANQTKVKGDMRRRALRFRIVPSCERPSERTNFKFRDLLGHVTKHRADYVSAGLTLMSAYLKAGAPCDLQMQGSFESWIRTIAGAIAWAGGPDVTAAWWHRSDQDGDEQAAEHGAQLDFLDWLAHAFPQGAEAPDIAHALLMPDTSNERLMTARYATALLFDAKSTEQPSARQVGCFMSSIRDRVIGGYRIRGTKGKDRRVRWIVGTL